MPKSLVNLYYLTLGFLILSAAVFTIYTSSQAVPNGQTITDLQKQRQVLATQELELNQEIGQATTLASAQQLAQANGFVFTTQLVQLPTQTQVALR
jgi:hypothetical protein